MSASTEYFNLHTVGIGYVRDFRRVHPKRGGEPFYAVRVSALNGPVDEPHYTRFDCRVSGAEALRRLQSIAEAIEAGTPVLVGFKIGDSYPDAFEYQSGDHAGETGCVIKGHLLQVRWAKINGEHVFPETSPGREPQPAQAVA